jgi:hypothetical protein
MTLTLEVLATDPSRLGPSNLDRECWVGREMSGRLRQRSGRKNSIFAVKRSADRTARKFFPPTRILQGQRVEPIQ